MAQRGRKSAASLSVVQLQSPAKPEPPAELSPQAAAEWRRITGALPYDWFTAPTQALLVQLCNHIVQARRIAGSIDAFETEWLADPEGLARYDKLLALAARESSVIASLSTKMRLTPQSRYQPGRAATEAAKGGRRLPWEFVS
jgi:hypothetical protein